MLPIWSGKARCFGSNVSGLCGTRNCTCVPTSVVELVWADSPKFLGNGYASHVAWVDVGRRGRVVIGAVRRGKAGMVARDLKELLTALDTLATRGFH